MMRRRVGIIFSLAVLCLSVACLLMVQPAYASGTNATQYADNHWNCVDSACTSTVSVGQPQLNFQCAEFVARALATEGLIVGLNSDSPQSDYASYHAANGNGYNLLWVGWANGAYTPTKPGLYQYLIDNNIATDIGKNPAGAGLDDVVIYHHGEGHTAIVVQTGSDPLVDAHNNAAVHLPNSQEYADFTILHLTASNTNPPTSGVASWPTVGQGSTGENVVSIQLMLAAHGYALSIDGSFGPQTAAAVKDFQSKAGLNVDGVVGPQTWPALIVPTSQGSTGPAVEALQRQLNAKGANLTVDSTFGAMTAAAVRNFQSSQGLSSDGIAGPQTWENLVG